MSRFVVLLVLTAGPVWAAGPTNAVSDPLQIEWPVIVSQLPASSGDGQASSDHGMLRGEYGDGARIVLIDPDGSSRVLTGGFHSACDPDVAFDGSRFLFAGKRSADDAWNIFEMTIADLSIRQVTDQAGNCRSPIYQSTLFTLDSPEPWYQLTFVSDAAGTRNDDGIGLATHLYSCKLDGSTVRRLTYNVSSDFDPFLMQDGRLLFSSWQRSTFEHGARGRVRLFGVNLDGTDYALFADPTGPAIQHMPCVTPSGWVVFVAADRVPWDGAGQLAAVSYRRPLRTFRMLTGYEDGLYHSPSPSPDGAVLVARRPASGTGTHGVGRFDPANGRWQAVFDDPDWHDIQPRVVYRRALADGRSSVVREERPNGKLYCLDVYLTDFEQSDWMPPSSVKRVRVLEGVPAAAEGRDAATASDVWPPLTARRILGEADVSADGSFHLEVPANLPLELQTLDADGLALRSCSWIWVKNNENRGCIGCHEDGELSPDGRFVDALSLAGTRLTPPAGERRTVDFRRDLMPIIQDRCVPCHGADQAEPYLDGSLQLLGAESAAAVKELGQAPPEQPPSPRFDGIRSEPVPFFHSPAGAGINRDYASLLAREVTDDPNALVGRYVQPGRARTSPLIWHIFGRNTSRPWDGAVSNRPAKPIPPGQVEPLTSEQKQMFMEWIDLGAAWGEPNDH